jgi:glycosyltransferase involved in cell wall biosynthesis
MSQLSERGHQCEDEEFERQVFCDPCMSAGLYCGPYDVQWDQEESHCASCKRLLVSAADIQVWKKSILDKINQSDVVVFQRPVGMSHLRLMRLAKSAGKVVVQTADDDYLNIPEWNPGHQFHVSRREIIEESFRISDAVDVTTPYLKQLYSNYLPNVEVIPNCLDLDLISAMPPVEPIIFSNNQKITPPHLDEKRQGRKMIFWSGGPSHEKDLELIVGAVRRISRSEDVVFGLMGYAHRALLEIIPQDRLFLFSAVPCMNYYQTYKAIKPEISLAPVVDIPFNRGKSNLKVTEAMAIGSFPIASAGVTYGDSIGCGMATPNDERSWFEALREACRTDLSERVKANTTFVRKFDIKENAPLWERFYQTTLERK